MSRVASACRGSGGREMHLPRPVVASDWPLGWHDVRPRITGACGRRDQGFPGVRHTSRGDRVGGIPLSAAIRRTSGRCDASARLAHRWRRREVGHDEAGNAVKRASAALMALPLAASVLLAGCGGDSQPQASPSSNIGSSPTTTAPPTTTASPTSPASRAPDPNIPASARAHTPAGAEAFVRYFYKQVNIAGSSDLAGHLGSRALT